VTITTSGVSAPPTIAQPALPERMGAEPAVPREPDPSPPAVPPAVAGAGTVHVVRSVRPARLVGVASAFLGTSGILIGLLIAVVNLSQWPNQARCTAYAQAHHSSTGFGCGSGSKSAATILPPVGMALLVMGMLALVWIPDHSLRRRGVLLAGFVGVLVLAVFGEVLVYAALPR
jgi:hypothetical protein